MVKNILLNREDSYIFHQVGVIPLHPLVREKFEENNNCLDYSLMNESLDEALEWLYQDIVNNPDLLTEVEKGHYFLQDKDSRRTREVNVIKEWLNRGNHDYFQEVNDVRYSSDDQRNFPLRGLSLDEGGIYIGQNPTILQYDQVIIMKSTLEFFGKDTPAVDEVMKSYDIRDVGFGYKPQGFWYVKDGQNLVKLFGKNFAINYTNRLLEKELL